MKTKKPGRPKSPEKREKFTTTLPPKYVAVLREIGMGNASAGIMTLVHGFVAEYPETAKKAGWK